MKGDFTRNTYDPRNHYSRVLMQQGRVQLDADWNEQGAIFSHYLRALARDLIGPHAAPAGSNGLQVVIDPNLIAKYDGSLLKDSTIASDKKLLQRLSGELKKGTSFVINPGRYYVEGILIENRNPMLYSDQAGFDAQIFGDQKKTPYVVYLDVWERHITCVEDPHIREIALGGPDTTTRLQIVWQVKTDAHYNSDQPCNLGGTPKQPGSGLLRARAKQGSPSPEPCVIAPSSSYRGAENQLYRVEILRAGVADGTATGASYIWSRENGSVVLPIVNIGAASTLANGTTQLDVTLASLGCDKKLGLHSGDWVSVVDDTAVLQNRADPLLKVIKIDRDTMTVTLQGSTLVSNASTHPLLRRWDQKTGVNVDGALPVQESDDSDAGLLDKNWITLEDGVQIWFAKGGSYCTGDYWLIPARVANGDIDWPDEIQADGSMRMLNGSPVTAELSAEGPRHYYAPLGVFTANAAGAPAINSCLCTVQTVTQCDTGQAGKKKPHG